MDDAGSSDQLVGRVAAHVESRTGLRDLARHWPDMHLRERANDGGVIQVHLDPTELSKLRDLPQNDR